MKVACNKSNPPLGGLLAVEFYKSSAKQVEVTWDGDSYVVLPNSSKKVPYATSNDLIRILENAFNKAAEPLQRVTMNHWLSFSLILEDEIPKSIEYLDKTLGPLTYLVGESLSVSDLAVFSVLYGSARFKDVSKKNPPKNIIRWMKLIEAQPCVATVLKELPAEALSNISKASSRKSPAANEGGSGRQQEGKFVELPHAEMGKVVVRFPPEASGFLHIGHAKAALLNQYYQQAFQGKLIMRFDDTNPAKENAEYEKVILEDVEMLEIKPDLFTHTSQYFDLMLDYCVNLIKEGKAFVDDTPAEQMKNEREQKIDSKNRNNSVEKNLQLWEEMKKASDIGVQCCVRAKIDMQSPNGCMRDPTIYRCKPEVHPRTGTQYKVYPTYDFACPIVDSIEGVTHVLRTMEYHDRDPQFYWFIDALGIRKPYIWEYSRLSMTNTVLSKRKLTWFVNEGLVDGWDDPRMPTVRGVLRRGMTVEGLRQFITAQGSSRSVVFMEWDKIWAINKKVIDPIAPRYTTLETNPVPVNLKGVSESTLNVALHPKNPDVGSKTVHVAGRLLIDQVDAKTLKEGENATFINYGNIMIDKIHKAADGTVTSIDATPNLDNKDYKKTLKLTWLADTPKSPTVEVYCVYFDHIISKPLLGKDEDFKQYIGHKTRWEIPMLGEPELLKVKVGDIIQLQRRGFFRVDVAAAPPSPHTSRPTPLVLFHVPDGHTKEMPGQPKPAAASPAKQPAAAPAAAPAASAASELNEQITKQGDLVRSLKSAKAEKAKVDEAVKALLDLKAKYKAATGQDWKPGAAPSPAASKPAAAPSSSSGDAASLNEQITKQGDLVRSLKSAKAEKAKVDEAVKALLDLKAKYKAATGQDWKPGASPAAAPQKQSETDDSKQVALLLKQIAAQGDKVRKVKADKAEKNVIDVEVKNLLNLKAQYKAITGTDWTPAAAAAPAKETKADATPAAMNGGSAKATELGAQITKQGDLVRELKGKKADKAVVDAEVKKLLELKALYQAETGTAFAPPVQPRDPKPKEKKDKPKEVKKEAKAKEQSPKPAKEESSSGVKKVTRLGLEASKDTDLPEWYSQVITKSEMIDYYDISGCYILRPWSYSIWDCIRNFLSAEFRKLGVKDGYFPIFVSKAALEREKDHIADFAPEVAWVTHSGSSELAEHIAIRPTSETVMYPAYAKWIQSHRDLPYKLNQWNNVVRWEFKQPQPFLRTREFLWQEGHTAFRLQEEAAEEVLQILDLYARVYEELMAIPVIKGRKTEKEKFAGGDYTTTVEAYIPASGRAIQGATSHHLGQNFSKMFEVVYDDPDTQEKKYVYQNSWGITTRTIGVMVLVHGDDKGLVLPPRVADVQAIVVPCGITASSTTEERNKLMDSCKDLVKDLLAAGIRAEGDYRDNYSPGWKFNHWELKGVPVRVELGPKDMARGEIVAVQRLTGDKKTFKRADAGKLLLELLDQTHNQMFDRATKERDARLSLVTKWDDFTNALERKFILLAPFCGEIPCEDKIKNDSARTDDDPTTEVKAPAMGAKSLCIPFKQPRELTAEDKCINPSCTNKPKFITLFGRSY
ncbi:bifunctional glutamate/proline--tRNA ligase isoform X9 [Spodoptera frugiperda]|uniref:Bifunctional glutamate/proline--tRNA ligase n=1 Tax=Spodoptera frugiperda TaxID=7108 RepID=A0A9R0DQQ5_SPOFR|nr:bifunctional glutamate/proline--tRNA ligase isoform X7 [Spodoptera frugiperda]XP_050551485.1 bifunctional glutamate/proline--tRNA ligase isoform X8 [Spodoptera frugiperda]XP_050551486.1 bifunctional glutamate/proline--tRNA ligase isoform X9 [Spodoptera frugiperda]